MRFWYDTKFMYLCIIIGFSRSLFAFFLPVFISSAMLDAFVYPRAFHSKRHVDFILLYYHTSPPSGPMYLCVRACVHLFLRLYWIYRAYRLLVYVIVFVCSIACRLIPFLLSFVCARSSLWIRTLYMYCSSTLVIDLSHAFNGFWKLSYFVCTLLSEIQCGCARFQIKDNRDTYTSSTDGY